MEFNSKTILITIGLVAVGMIALFTTGWMPIIISAIIIGILIFLAHALGIRVHRKAAGMSGSGSQQVEYERPDPDEQGDDF